MSRSDLLPPTVYLIDFQGFQHGSEEFVIKEMCILDVSKPTRPLHTVYLPPCCWFELSREQKRTYHYQSRALHKLGWDEGNMRFCKECLLRAMDRWLFNTNSRNLSVFYVMGHQKAEILQRLRPECNIVNYQEAYNLRALPEATSTARCVHREHGDYCAVKKCYAMYWHFITL